MGGSIHPLARAVARLTLAVALLASGWAATFAPAWGQDAGSGPDVAIGLAEDTIVITSSFDGTDLVVFGTVTGVDPETVKPGDFDIVVALAGPREELTVRRKEQRAGIWINGRGEKFGNVPSSYSIATSRPLGDIAAPGLLKQLQLGFENLDIKSLSEQESAERTALFRSALTRRKMAQSLFVSQPKGVSFLKPTLFRARLEVPANVPIGPHRARAYLFSKGNFMTTRSVLLQVRKSGLERAVYDLAYSNGLLYGLLAVLMAVVTGWTASVLLRKD